MLKKLQAKFVLMNMAIVAVMLLAIFTLMFQYTKSDLNDECDKVFQILTQDPTGADARAIQTPYFILDVSIHGTVSISGTSYHDLNDEAFIQELIQMVYTADRLTGEIEKYELRYEVVAGLISHRLIFVDTSGHRVALESLVQGFIFVGIGALGAFLGISFLLSKWAVRPVEKAWKQQKQFVSDASHELKTPLTVIMSNAELLQNPEFDGESKQQFVGSILIKTQQMRHLVDSLLELARADNGQVKKAFAQFDLSRELSDGILPFEPVFYEKGLLLESDIQPDIQVKGSSGHLRQVLEILLDN
ncbi:MAG: HAMP domain-containing histidine kinase, partial [Oscillospiraceae bacterium]|nr:HAMP domain-containing histidine kinase [Oscillospiraceae bacterium]